MPASASLAGVLRRPFAEQVDFFRRKINLPTDRWDDIWQSAHDRAFVVAGAAKADLLQDLRDAVDKAVADGTTLAEFRRDFRAILEKHGWTGWTGEGTKKGEAWRTRTIYQTNLRTSYAAGRYAQLTDRELLSVRPYWRWVNSDLPARPRAHHKHWGETGLTLRHDHDFWKLHFPPQIPPNWGCRCRVVAARGPAEGDATEPPANWREVDTQFKPRKLVDAGWNFAPGANAATPLLDLVGQKLLNLDAPIGAAMWQALRPAIQMEQRLALAGMVDAVSTSMRAGGSAALVTVVAPETVSALARMGHALETADVWLRDEELLHALRDAKTARDAALPLQAWRDLPRMLETAQAYWDTEDPALVYAVDTEDGLGKVLVRINYRDKLRVGSQRTRVRSNFVRTGGVIEAGDLSPGRYVPL